MKPIRKALILIITVSLIVSGAFASPLNAQCDVADKYLAVLDAVFPSSWGQCRGPQAFSLGTPEIMIRVLPSFFHESHIFICGVEGGGFFVVSSTPDPKDKSVWSHMMKSRRIDDRSSVAEPAKEPVEKIAASIHIIHKSCNIDANVVEEWFRSLADVRMSLPLLGGGNDGTTYEVTLRHGMDVMHARIWEREQQKPLIAFIDAVSQRIEAAECKEIRPPNMKG